MSGGFAASRFNPDDSQNSALMLAMLIDSDVLVWLTRGHPGARSALDPDPSLAHLGGHLYRVGAGLPR